MKNKKSKTISKNPALCCERNNEAGWVTLRLPRALTERAKQELVDFLFKKFWEHGTFQWVADNTLRLIAKRGAKFMENLTILYQWADRAVQRLLNWSAARSAS